MTYSADVVQMFWPVTRILEGPVPRAGMSQAYGRACPKSGPVPSIWKGLSQKRACPKYYEGPVGNDLLKQYTTHVPDHPRGSCNGLVDVQQWHLS